MCLVRLYKLSTPPRNIRFSPKTAMSQEESFNFISKISSYFFGLQLNVLKNKFISFYSIVDEKPVDQKFFNSKGITLVINKERSELRIC